MSGWPADNEDAPAAATGWAAEPPPAPPGAPGTPPAGPAAPPPDASAPTAWAAPESPNEPAWAPPEAPPGIAAPGPAPAPGRPPDPALDGGWTDAAEPRPAPSPPVPLRAMTATDVLDGAWAILKARPGTVMGITAMLLLPVEVLAAVLSRGDTALTELVDGGARPGVGLWVALALQNLVWFFLGAAIARLVSSWYGGGDLTAAQAVGAAFRKTPALLGAFALLLPVKAVAGAFSCLLALPFVVPLFLLTAPAIVIEDRGPWSGVRRSVELVRRRYWPCVGIWALALIIQLTVNFALSILPATIAGFLPETQATVVAAAGSVFAALVSAPFVVGVCVLLYLDLRIRTEGLDLELDAADVFARAA